MSIHLDEHDVEEMERLAKRMLALCSKYRAGVDETRCAQLPPPRVTAERKAELVAQMRRRLARKGVAV